MALVLALGSCTPAPAPTLPPPPPRIAAVPSLEGWVATEVGAYAEQQGVPGFDVDILPEVAASEAAQAGRISLVLTVLDPPAGWFAAPLASVDLAIIVHSSNPVQSLTLDELAGIFSGRITSWGSLGGLEAAVQPVIPLPEDGLRQRFEAAVMEGSDVSPAALLAPSPAVMVQLVGGEPGAIGYVVASDAGGEVRIPRVTGAGNPSPLRLTILGIAPEEPSGPVRDWLAWVQSR